MFPRKPKSYFITISKITKIDQLIQAALSTLVQLGKNIEIISMTSSKYPWNKVFDILSILEGVNETRVALLVAIKFNLHSNSKGAPLPFVI